MQTEKNINSDVIRINDCLNAIIEKMMKQHQLQIQSIIKNTLANPLQLMRFKDSATTNVDIGDDVKESYEKNNTEIEHLKKQISDHNEQLQHLNCAMSEAMSENYLENVTLLCENEHSELKYLLVKDELTKRQTMFEEVLLINEALQIKIKEYEVDNLNLPLLNIPKTVAHVSVQTDNTMESSKEMGEISYELKILNAQRKEDKISKSATFQSIHSKEIAQCRSLMASTISSQSNIGDVSTSRSVSTAALKETLCKLKIDQHKRKKKLEKMFLKNLSLKIEVCELKNEIKKYSNIWANDRYFNSLFLDATKKTKMT